MARSGSPDIGWVDTGTHCVALVTRVSDGWLDAPVVHDVKGTGDLPSGMWVCLLTVNGCNPRDLPTG